MLLRFKKGKRFYHLYQQDNLFGEISLICSWGSFNSNLGGHKIILCKDKAKLDDHVQNIRKIRIRRNYQYY